MGKIKYEIDVHEDHVIVWESLKVSELKSIIEFFEKQGFTEACVGSENSTLYLRKSPEPVREEEMSLVRILQRAILTMDR